MTITKIDQYNMIDSGTLIVNKGSKCKIYPFDDDFSIEITANFDATVDQMRSGGNAEGNGVVVTFEGKFSTGRHQTTQYPFNVGRNEALGLEYFLNASMLCVGNNNPSYTLIFTYNLLAKEIK